MSEPSDIRWFGLGQPDMDFGSGFIGWWTQKDGEKNGLLIGHVHADGERCLGAIDWVEKGWRVEQWEPLTISGSIKRDCGVHGHIRNGKWEPCGDSVSR